MKDGSPGTQRKLNVLQVCDHLGWEGSRMHGVKRLFAWMIPRFDKSRFNVSLVSLRKKDLSEETLELIRKVDPASLSPESGAALFWYARNALLFDTGLYTRPDVMVVSYDALVQAPQETMQPLCRFLGMDFDPAYAAHVDARAAHGRRVEIDDTVRAACDELTQRLDEVSARHRATA